MAPLRAFWLALLCSVSVYFIPIIGPHAAFFLWESLGQRLRNFGRNPAWAFTEFGVALVYQAIALGLCYWFWRRRGGLRLVVVGACAVAALIEAQSLFFARIPAMFLIEQETAPEKAGAWPEACRVTDGQLMTVRTPRRLPTDGWHEAWLQDSHARYSVLRMPDCHRTAVPLPQPTLSPGGGVDFTIGVMQVVPDGLALIQRHETAINKDSWMLANIAARTLQPLLVPQTTQHAQPYLSDDGSRTGWVVVIPGSGPPVLERLYMLRVTGSADERVIDLTPFGPNTYEVVDLDGQSGNALLWVSQPLPGHLLALGPDGIERRSPTIPPHVKPQSHTMLLLANGVVAWDAYQEDENYTVSWALDTGTGSHNVPKGSSPTAVAVDPAGRYVAISTTTSLNIGNTRDTVVVVRTSDGQEVFRRYLSAYNRTGVAFLGREYFAYSDYGTTYVLKIE